MEIRLPAGKRSKYLAALLVVIEGPSTATRRDLQSLLGKLFHAAQVVRMGKPFFRRVLNKTLAMKEKFFRVHLNAEDRKDLRWWNCCGVGTG